MTQGMITLTSKGVVKRKIIVGCDGYNAEDLADKIKEAGRSAESFTIAELRELAALAGFGCSTCRVVMDENASISHEEELHERYRRTFKNANFNPRWEVGTADYVFVIEC